MDIDGTKRSPIAACRSEAIVPSMEEDCFERTEYASIPSDDWSGLKLNGCCDGSIQDIHNNIQDH